MNKEKLMEIIENHIRNLETSGNIKTFTERLARKIIEYNDSIVYRKYNLDEKTSKCELEECR